MNAALPRRRGRPADAAQELADVVTTAHAAAHYAATALVAEGVVLADDLDRAGTHDLIDQTALAIAELHVIRAALQRHLDALPRAPRPAPLSYRNDTPPEATR